MKAIVLDVRSPADVMAGFAQAWKSSKAEKTARTSFANPELLWQVTTVRLNRE